jgi:zinc protease
MNSSRHGQEKFLFDNGLTLIVREMPGTELAALQIWVKTGSIYEEEFLGSGISHYVEHMLFEGTEKRSAEEIAKAFRMAGGKLNAFTSHEQTVYHVSLPAANLDIAAEVFADSIFHSAFDPETCERERQVICKEINMTDDDPDRYIYDLFDATCYLKHPYRYPVIGYETLFKKITREDLLTYYRRKYVPNNMVVVVTGDLETESVRNIIAKHFGSPQRGRSGAEIIQEEPRQISTRYIENEFPTEVARLMMGFQTINIFHADMAALDVLALILAKGESSRLYQQVKEEKNLVHYISGASYTPTFTGMFFISSYLDTKNLDKTISAIWEEIKKIQDEGVSPQELKKAQNKAISSHIMQQQTVEGEAHNLGAHETSIGDHSFADKYVEKIGQVSAEDVKRITNTYLQPDYLTTAVLKPRLGALEKKKPTPKKAAPSPLKKISLPNGMTLILKADSRFPIVSVRAMSLGGVRFETEYNNGIYNLLHQMLLKGTKNHSQKDIASGIEDLGGSLYSDSGSNCFGITLNILKIHLEVGLDIFADCLINPTFPQDKLSLVRQKTISDIRSQEDNLLSLGRTVLDKTLFRTHPYRLPILGVEETVKKITAEDLASLHREMVVPSNTYLAVFGDIDQKRITGLIEKKFSEFSPKNFNPPTIEPEQGAPRKRSNCLTLDKKQTVVLLGFNGPCISHPDRWGLTVLTEILSGLGSRLFQRIRSAMGLAYYVGSFMMSGIDQGSYNFYCGTVPEKAKVARDALLEEIRKIKETGVTKEEMKLARENLIGKKMLDRQRISSQAAEVVMDELFGLGVDYHREFNSHVKAVTQDDVRRVANLYFTEDDYAEVFVGGKVI